MKNHQPALTLLRFQEPAVDSHARPEFGTAGCLHGSRGSLVVNLEGLEDLALEA